MLAAMGGGVDPVALSIYNKLACWWEMDEVSAGTYGVTRLPSKANVANSLGDGGSGYVANAAGVRGSDIAAKFGRGSGGVLNGPNGAGANQVSNVIANEALCIFGWFWSEKLGDTNRTLAAKSVDGSASNTQWMVLSSTAGIRFQTRGTATTTFVDIANPSTSAWHFFVGWVDDADMRIRASIDDGTPVLGALPVSTPQAVASNLTFGKLSIYFPLGDASCEGRLAKWGWMRGNGNFLSATERTWLYNGGAGRTFAELKAAAGIP